MVCLCKDNEKNTTYSLLLTTKFKCCLLKHSLGNRNIRCIVCGYINMYEMEAVSLLIKTHKKKKPFHASSFKSVVKRLMY